MSTMGITSQFRNKCLTGGFVALGLITLAWIGTPNLLRIKVSPERSRQYAGQRTEYERVRTIPGDSYRAPDLAKAAGSSLMGTPSFLASKASPGISSKYGSEGRESGEAHKDSASGHAKAESSSDRKIVKTASVSLIVKDPRQSAGEVITLAEKSGGYVESSQVSGEDNVNAALTIRVPAARLEEIKAGLRKLSLHVESETTNAEDVTRQYVDQEARLRNLRAQETQYLLIMKSAAKVQDMLDVSEHLSEVRGEIEQQQAEFQTLSKQIEMATLVVSLMPQIDTAVFGLNWRPFYQLKLAARRALDGLADYANTMASMILYLPVLLLWGATFLFGAVVGWRVLRWAFRMFFTTPATV